MQRPRRPGALVVAAGITMTAVASTGVTTAPLIQASDFVYQGAFRVPFGPVGGSSFAYGGTALAFNGARNSLFVVGHDWDQEVAEITVPAIRNSSTLSTLATASVLQPFTDPTEGTMNAVGAGNVKVGGLLPYQGKLYLTAYLYYDAAGTQVRSHYVSGTDLSVGGDARGPYQVGTLGAGFVSGYFGLVPAEWQTLLGGPVINGQCCLAIISRTSYGPALFAINPTQLGTTNPVPATPLVYYPSANPLASWSSTGTLFNGTTEVRGVVFPGGTRSVLFFGRHGLGTFCYGTGGTSGECYDPDDTSKGTHAYPYSYYVWGYDANDLAAVKAGQRQPWSVTPYTVWPLTLPIGGGSHLQGAAYDPATGRIFVSQAHGDGEYPVIHVFTLRVQAPPPPLPAAPRNLRIIG